MDAQAGLDLRPVPASLLPLVPLFCRCLTEMGTQSENFIELTERIGRKTGGFAVYPFTSSVKGEAEPVSHRAQQHLDLCDAHRTAAVLSTRRQTASVEPVLFVPRRMNQGTV